MSNGNGSITFTAVQQSPGTILNANNGLSENPSGTAVLGQAYGAAGNPAILLSNREIPMNAFILSLRLGQLMITGAVNHFSAGQTKITADQTETSAGGATTSNNRVVFFDKTITLGEPTNFTNYASCQLNTNYLAANATTSFADNYQNASVLTTYFAGGFLDQAGAPVQTITAPNTAQNALTIQLNKFLFQNNDTKNVSGFICNFRSVFETRSAGTINNFADIIIGGTQRIGANGIAMIITNRVGLRIEAIKDSANTTTGYSIAAVGASDIAFFQGQVSIGSAAPGASSKLQVDSTTQSFVVPRMTNAQRIAIAAPLDGSIVYCTDAAPTIGFWSRVAGVWVLGV